MWFVLLFSFNSQILKTSNSFHRQFAKKISSALLRQICLQFDIRVFVVNVV